MTITLVTRDLVPRLDTALRALGAYLGDPYRTQLAALEAAVCGADAPCLALLAMRGEATLGALMAAPVFSTKRGGAGLFVSDIWVAEEARGQGLARSLLARALDEGARWDADGFVKLAVYADNPGARAVYDRLGFEPQSDETTMMLSGAPLEALRGV